MSEVLLEAKGLTKIYNTPEGGTLRACHHIDLAIYAGETVGLVGESGGGKSTVLNILGHLESPTEGRVYYRGKDVTDLQGEELRQHRRHVQIVFQDPSSVFYPRMTMGEALLEPLKNYGLVKRGEQRKVLEELLDLVELPYDFMDRYPHAMSGGQRQRLGIARALALSPDVLLCDEATSALDVSIQDTMVRLLVDLQKKKNLGMLFVCHDLALVQKIAHRVAVLYLGEIMEILPGEKVAREAMHPYTLAMIDAIFPVHGDLTRRVRGLRGEVPSATNVPSGCPFHHRCFMAKPICRDQIPELLPREEGHFVACHCV